MRCRITPTAEIVLSYNLMINCYTNLLTLPPYIVCCLIPADVFGFIHTRCNEIVKKTIIITYFFSQTKRNLFTYLLTPWSRVLLEELTGSAASQEIPRLFGTRRFLTVPTSACHLSLSWANSLQSPQLPPTSWRSSLILSSHLCLGLPNGLFPSGFPTRK